MGFDFNMYTLVIQIIAIYWNGNELRKCIPHLHVFIVSLIVLLCQFLDMEYISGALFCSLCISIMLTRTLMCPPAFTPTCIKRGEAHSFHKLSYH